MLFNQNEKLKVIMLLRTFLKLTIKQGIFATLCHLLTFGFTNLLQSENVRCMLITPKAKLTSSSRWPNYW